MKDKPIPKKMKGKYIMRVVGYIFPFLRPWLGLVDEADKQLDNLADQAEKERKKLIEKIRDNGSIGILIICLSGLSGCATTRQLEKEGYKLSTWQKIQINTLDVIIDTDKAVDWVMD